MTITHTPDGITITQEHKGETIQRTYKMMTETKAIKHFINFTTNKGATNANRNKSRN